MQAVAVAVVGYVCLSSTNPSSGGVFGKPVHADILGVNADSGTTAQLNSGATAAVKHTITVRSDSSAGYYITLEADPSRPDLATDGGYTISRLAGASQLSPRQLQPGTWGYAVAGRHGFDDAYEEALKQEAVWASVPTMDDSGEVVAETTTVSAVSGDRHEVWFGIRSAEEIMMAGTYTANVIYTVTANPIAPPVLTLITPNSYNLGDETDPATVVITGQNLGTTRQVCVDLNHSQGCDSDELATPVSEATFSQIQYDLPNRADITPGVYDIYVTNDGGTEVMAGAFTYSRVAKLTGVTPNQYELEGDRPASIAGGQHHTIVLTDSGQVFTSGSNSNGQLGTGDGADHSALTNITTSFSGTVVQISATGNHSLALTDGGRVYGWGSNSNGQIGDGSIQDASRPVDITSQFKLPAGVTVRIIYAGWDASYAITNDNRIFAWGHNNQGQLGLGHTNDVLTPEQIEFDFGNIIDFAADSHVLVLNDAGQVYSWGNNQVGQADVSQAGSHILVPTDITDDVLGNSGGSIVSVHAASQASLVLMNNDTLRVWGQNDDGNLGLSGGSGAKVESITTVDLSQSVGDVVEVKTGFYVTMALDSDGNVYVWGRNSGGQLGLGTVGDSVSTPTRITGLTNITSIYATGNVLSAVDANGITYSWGDGSVPQNISGEIDYSIIVISGANLDGVVEEVYIDLNRDGQPSADEVCKDLSVTSTRLTCSIPTDRLLIQPGVYTIYATAYDSTVSPLSLPDSFAYLASGRAL